MVTVTIRPFRDIGPQWLKPLVEDLRHAAADALSTDQAGEHVDSEGVDVVVVWSSSFDVSAHDLVITIEAADMGRRSSDAEKSARHILHQAGESLRISQYPQLATLKYRVDLRLDCIKSVSSDR